MPHETMKELVDMPPSQREVIYRLSRDQRVTPEEAAKGNAGRRKAPAVAEQPAAEPEQTVQEPEAVETPAEPEQVEEPAAEEVQETPRKRGRKAKDDAGGEDS